MADGADAIPQMLKWKSTGIPFGYEVVEGHPQPSRWLSWVIYSGEAFRRLAVARS